MQDRQWDGYKGDITELDDEISVLPIAGIERKNHYSPATLSFYL